MRLSFNFVVTKSGETRMRRTAERCPVTGDLSTSGSSCACVWSIGY